jgi:hypothetical protein
MLRAFKSGLIFKTDHGVTFTQEKRLNTRSEARSCIEKQDHPPWIKGAEIVT